MRAETVLPSQAVFAGRHVLAEFAGIDAGTLDDPEALRLALTGALTDAGATVREVIAHRFHPQGVTVLAMLAESHASVHTYPELGAAFVDVFTCGNSADPEQAVELLAEALGAPPAHCTTVRRGDHRAGPA